MLTVANGAEALALYADNESRIALVLTDRTMPEIGEGELFHRLQQRTPDVTLIVLTGYLLGDEERSLLDQGIVPQLQKPPALAALMETLGKAVADAT